MTPGSSTPTQANAPHEPLPTASTAAPPPPAPPAAASPPNKRDLKSWWKGFKQSSKHQDASGTDDPSSRGCYRPLPPSSYLRPPRIVMTQFREDDYDEAGPIPESLLVQHDHHVTTIASCSRIRPESPPVSSSDATREQQRARTRSQVSERIRECFKGHREAPDSPPLPTRITPAHSPVPGDTERLVVGSKLQGIFGVPLRQSITYANVAISLIDENGSSYIYGYVPIVVAKCGVYLKEKATEIEGIFRLSGSEKRIKELKTIFDSPDRYGKGLVWDGYTVHDASNVFRRYLNDLPEPVVPLDLYEKFREPLRGATKQQAAGGDAEGPQFVENFDEQAAIENYQQLITELPPLNRQLLLYILDLLAVFAAKSDINRMNSQNLAAIFQPGILSHPNHAMAPEEYKLNQCVLIFLIENQDHFLIGMQGTAADEKTRREVETGAASTNPVEASAPATQETSGLGRSASNASAGAESVRRDGMIRRNRSTSSRHSRHEAAGSTTPNSPSLATTPTTGLGRSNTVPSKKSPALPSGRFQNEPSPLSSRQMSFTTGADEISSTSDRSTITPATVGASTLSPGHGGSAGRSQERLLEPHAEPMVTPSKERNLPIFFQRSPTNDSSRPRNKLKKRIPGSMNQSAHSSSASLHHHSSAASPSVEITNPMEPLEAPIPERLLPVPHQQQQQQSAGDSSSEITPRGSQNASNTLHPENTLKAKKSPPTSLHSSFNEGSDIDHIDEHAMGGSAADAQEKEKRRRWRISRSAKRDEHQPPPPQLPPPPPTAAPPPGQAPAGAASGVISPRSAAVGASNSNAEASTTSVASSGVGGGGGGRAPPRMSFGNDGLELALSSSTTDAGQLSHESSMKDKDEAKGGPIGWIRSKYREAKENHEHRRNKSPPASDSRQQQQTLGSAGGGALPTRAKSSEAKREDEKMVQATTEMFAPEAPNTAATVPQPTAHGPKTE